MTTALTPGQHALLETELKLARQRIEAALLAQREGSDRLAHAAALQADDPHDVREHGAERELDQARDDHLLTELQALDDALMRLKTPTRCMPPASKRTSGTPTATTIAARRPCTRPSARP